MPRENCLFCDNPGQFHHWPVQDGSGGVTGIPACGDHHIFRPDAAHMNEYDFMHDKGLLTLKHCLERRWEKEKLEADAIYFLTLENTVGGMEQRLCAARKAWRQRMTPFIETVLIALGMTEENWQRSTTDGFDYICAQCEKHCTHAPKAHSVLGQPLCSEECVDAYLASTTGVMRSISAKRRRMMRSTRH